MALGPDSLASVQRHARPTHWLLSVESPDLVRSSHHLPGTILWLGARPAARLLGALADVPLGAWLHPDGVEIRIDDGPPILLPRPGSPDAEPNVDELARLLVREWRKIGLAARARESATLRQASGILEEVAA